MSYYHSSTNPAIARKVARDRLATVIDGKPYGRTVCRRRFGIETSYRQPDELKG